MINNKIRIGVIGLGYLGKFHYQKYKASKLVKLTSVVDTNIDNYTLVTEKSISKFKKYQDIVDHVDAVSIVTPTSSHFKIAKYFLEKKVHVLLEKPMTETVAQARKLNNIAKKNNCILQIGHLEQFNPAIRKIRKSNCKPQFIEVHRLCQFNPRANDVDVVLDLMIHDIDILLSIVKSKVKIVSASGVSVISNTPDIANARIEFENGCVANLTASRISLKKMRKTRFFQKDAYISVDFLEKKVEIVKMKEAPEKPKDFAMILQNAEGQKKEIYFENPIIDNSNAILEELETFSNAIENKTVPVVSLENGTAALKLAYQIMKAYS